MLLKEFLKEHRKVEEQNRKIQEHKATITQLNRDFGATIARITALLDEHFSNAESERTD